MGEAKGLAEVLAEHGADVTSYDAGDIHGCDCRWQVPEMPNEVRWSGGDWDAYRAHLEAAVLGWVRERLAGAREGAVGALVAAWSLNTAEREGWNDPSAHARGMTDAALSAVAEALGVGEVRG